MVRRDKGSRRQRQSPKRPRSTAVGACKIRDGDNEREGEYLVLVDGRGVWNDWTAFQHTVLTVSPATSKGQNKNRTTPNKHVRRFSLCAFVTAHSLQQRRFSIVSPFPTSISKTDLLDKRCISGHPMPPRSCSLFFYPLTLPLLCLGCLVHSLTHQWTPDRLHSVDHRMQAVIWTPTPPAYPPRIGGYSRSAAVLIFSVSMFILDGLSYEFIDSLACLLTSMASLARWHGGL